MIYDLRDSDNVEQARTQNRCFDFALGLDEL